MIVTLKAKSSTIDIKNVSFQIHDKNFFDQISKDVRVKPKQMKLLLSTISITITMLVSNFISQPVMAAPMVDVDPDLKKSILIIMGLVACLAIAAAFIAWMAAGTWKMFFGGSAADSWTIDIIKGLVQVLSAPVVITFIVWLFVLLFGNLSAFGIIKDAVNVWFQN